MEPKAKCFFHIPYFIIPGVLSRTLGNFLAMKWWVRSANARVDSGNGYASGCYIIVNDEAVINYHWASYGNNITLNAIVGDGLVGKISSWWF